MSLSSRYAFGFVLCFLGWAASPQTQDELPSATGTARGVVADLEGKPVAGATVFLGGAIHARVTTSASDGSFELTQLPSGQAYLMAYKVADGYPYNADNFFSMPGEKFPSVEIAPNRVTEGVSITLGAKGAYLDFDVSDDSGTPEPAAVYFWRPDHDKGPGDWSYSMHLEAIRRVCWFHRSRLGLQSKCPASSLGCEAEVGRIPSKASSDLGLARLSFFVYG